MRCNKCGANNPSKTGFCGECGASIGNHPSAGGPPPKGTGGKKSPVAMIIIIVVIVVCVLIAAAVAVSVVLAGGLYVWTTSLADTESSSVTILNLNADDASATVYSEGADFPAGTQLLRVEQRGGDPINWNELTVYANEKDTDVRVALAIDTINGMAYSSATNYQSTAGQTIMLKVVGGSDFQGGDYVVLNIFKGENKVFTSTAIRVI